MLSALFQLEIEMALENYCQKKDHTSPEALATSTVIRAKFRNTTTKGENMNFNQAHGC